MAYRQVFVNGIVILLLTLLMPRLAQSGETVIPATETRSKLIDNLTREGYIGRFNNGQDLQRGMSAYLWDNRSWFKEIDFHKTRQVEALVCLMIRKGYGNFPDYAVDSGFMKRCGQLVH